jgi:hypothetical protein
MICRRIARLALRLSVRLIHQAAKYQAVRVDDFAPSLDRLAARHCIGWHFIA